MTRSRSPQYPSLSLPQAIDMVEKLHKANRTSVISRETAAQDMGYSGLTGRSLTVLAALAQYGLVERAGKGDIKVSFRAVDILHSVDEADRTEAIQEAAFAPNLFKQLHERFPEGVPSQNALRSHLIKQDFGDVALGPAISAFLETIAFAENAKENGRSGEGASSGAVPIDHSTPETPMQPLPAPPTPNVTTAASAFPNVLPDLNKIEMNIRGEQVLITGLLDIRGLRLLKKRIENLEALLAPYVEDEHAAVFLADEDHPN